MPTSAASVPGGAEETLLAQDVCAGYGGELVVKGVTMAVNQGEIVTIVGPNGSGKSTFVKALTNVIPVRAGRVVLRGADVTNIGTDALTRRGVGYVPQLNDVFPPLTVEENLAVGGYLLPKQDVTTAIDQVLSLFPALAVMRRRVAARLSGGERKMLAIGRALIPQPSVLIVDEPTANLAPAIAHAVLDDYVRRLRDDGVAVLLVEQRARHALAIADWGHVMNAGQLAASDRASELLAREDIGQLFLGGSASPRASVSED